MTKSAVARRKSFKKAGTLVHYDMESNINIFERASTIKEDKSKDVGLKELQGRSLWCFGPDNAFRMFCQKWFAENATFNWIILALIGISTLTLAAETPLDDPDGKKIKILEAIDLFMTIAFVLEAAVKIIAWGFAFSGKNSYIRDAWNVLDFVIVAGALLGLLAGDAIDISFIKALRILKILRPLRMIAKNRQLKLSIISLGRSIPKIVRLQVIVIFFVFLFAILQTTIFSGSFNYCSTDHLELTAFQTEQNIVTMWDCYNYGGEWITPYLNFDTTLSSLLTLLTIQSTEGWIGVMWASVDAVDPYYVPQLNENVFMIPYTMVIILSICMLFIELFVGVVTETFSNQKILLTGNQCLGREQKLWLGMQMMVIGEKPQRKLEPTGKNCVRDFCIKLTEHKKFDLFIMICILANTFILAFNWYMRPDSYEDPIQVINYIFMAIFTIEAIVKIIAQKLAYFKDSWN